MNYLVWLYNNEEWINSVIKAFENLGATVKQVTFEGEKLNGIFRISCDYEQFESVDSLLKTVIKTGGEIVSEKYVMAYAKSI